jgi:hypothetical protein
VNLKSWEVKLLSRGWRGEQVEEPLVCMHRYSGLIRKRVDTAPRCVLDDQGLEWKTSRKMEKKEQQQSVQFPNKTCYCLRRDESWHKKTKGKCSWLHLPALLFALKWRRLASELSESLLPLDVRHFCPTFSAREGHHIVLFLTTPQSQFTMAGKYELLCLENPLLDIQGVG